MADRTENLIAGTFRAISELENGDMIVCRNSGEILPVDQVIKDPLHIDKLDFLDTDRIGGVKLGPIDQHELDEEEEVPDEEEQME